MENASNREERSTKQVQQTKKLCAAEREGKASSREKDLHHKKIEKQG
jgi:hypothetical protein